MLGERTGAAAHERSAGSNLCRAADLAAASTLGGAPTFAGCAPVQLLLLLSWFIVNMWRFNNTTEAQRKQQYVCVYCCAGIPYAHPALCGWHRVPSCLLSRFSACLWSCVCVRYEYELVRLLNRLTYFFRVFSAVGKL